MNKTNYLRFRPDFGIGDLEKTVAEDDSNLQFYYVGEELYVKRALDREDLASIFIGPKGVGKSAILQMVRADAQATGNTKRLIEVLPEDLSFNALLDIDSQSTTLQLQVNKQFLFRSLWDYVISVEILRHEYPTRSGFVASITQLIGDQKSPEQKKLLALTLDEDGAFRTYAEKMMALVNAVEIEGHVGSSGASARVELSEAAPKTRGVTLLQLVATVAKSLRDTITHEYFILVDDLDMDWKDTPLQNAFLGGMFQSIRRLSKNAGIKFVVSLRSSIYRHINFDERDKFSSYVIEVEWGKAAVQEMVELRLEFIFEVSTSDIWGKLFPGSAFDYLWDNTDGMPREVTRIAVECIKSAIRNGNSSVTESDVNDGAGKFSVDRLGDLASQFQYQYPRLGIVLKQFAGGPKEFPIERLHEVAFKISELVEKNANLKDLDWAAAGLDDPTILGRPLLQCGFLQLKTGRSARPRVPNDDEITLLDESSWFSIHPMYHAGLELDGLTEFK